MMKTSLTLIERTRSKHEEIERLERMVMKELETPSCDNLLIQGHSLRRMIECIILKTESLVETYEDTVKKIKDEIEPPSRDALGLFRDRLQEIHEYHREHGFGDLVVEPHVDGDLKWELLTIIRFDGEEDCGRYLDLRDMYSQYINCEFGERVEYSAYLDVFSQPEKIPPQQKLSSQYNNYMQALLEYLIGFYKRTQPLQDVDIILSRVENEVIPSNQHTSVIDLDCYTTVEELIHVWPELLEEALEALKLETGGTRQQRAERLFSTKHKKKNFGKAKENIALAEAKVKKLCNLLDETIKRTKQKVEKKQALVTFGEMEKEGELVPMGWDGNPIPYLLYKLHDDLGREFKCEMVCGNNYSYWGRRAFERHFNECRHQSRLKRKEQKQVRQEYIPIQPASDYVKKTEQPPPEIRVIIEKTALFVLRDGLDFEKKMMGLNLWNAKFNFLRETESYHAFYKLKLVEYYQEGRGTEPSDDYYDPVSDEVKGPAIPERHKYSVTCPRPRGITYKQLDILMLKAQFEAWYGSKFGLELMKSDIMDSVLLDTRDAWYSELLVAYYHVVKPPKDLKEKLRDSAADMTSVLERCFHRLQWKRFLEQQSRKREERNERTRKWVYVPPPMKPCMPAADSKSHESPLTTNGTSAKETKV